jgi:hypothetical protein
LTATALILASLAGQLFRFVTGHDEARGVIPLFYVDNESNVPSYFSAALLLVAALLLGAIAFVTRHGGGRYHVRWMLLAFTFLYLSIDEAVGFHEWLNGPVRDLLGPRAPRIFFFAWVVPGAAAAVVLGLAFLKLLWEFPDRIRRSVVAGAALFVGGTIGVELIGGWFFSHYGDSFAYSLIATVEESAEMAGIIVFIHALLEYLGQTIGELRLTFTRS